MFSLLSPTLTWWEILSTKDIAAVQSERLMKMISFLLLGENVFDLQKKTKNKSQIIEEEKKITSAKKPLQFVALPFTPE